MNLFSLIIQKVKASQLNIRPYPHTDYVSRMGLRIPIEDTQTVARMGLRIPLEDTYPVLTDVGQNGIRALTC